MTDTGPIVRNSEEVALNASHSVCRSRSATDGVSLVFSRLVVVSSGWCAGRVDARPYVQARHRRFCPANLVDGDRQGPEEGMGTALAGALSRAPWGCDGADPDYRAAVLVRRADRFRHSHRGRPRQGFLLLSL